jgi:hypothetical protein
VTNKNESDFLQNPLPEQTHGTLSLDNFDLYQIESIVEVE